MEIKFKKLTPVDDVNLSTYKQAIDFAMNSDDLNNIAISGAYGSGKTSVMESYKKQDTNNNYLTISLAHFKSEDKDPENIEKILEKKIINQLVHKIPVEKIPLTNFKLKANLNRRSIWITTIVSVVFILLLLYVLYFKNVVEYIKAYAPVFDILDSRILQIIAAVFCVVIFTVGLKNLIKVFKSKTVLKRLKIKDAEIEMDDEEKEASYFDKYLNDVLYVFESCEENIFVFEDLDRFDSVIIFERLREINNLVNCKLKKQSNSKKSNVKFFYLLRDDVFESKERTKFFDFLIPIVPVIDGSNSYEKILEFFTDDKFEKQFLSDLSLYIDDMRLLENIYNEYKIYENELKKAIANPNKLLALIVYKNIFPKDFADLQLGQSFVNAVFSTKEQLIYERKSEIDEKIKHKKEMLDTLKKEVLKSKNELEVLFNNDQSKHIRQSIYNRLTDEASADKAKRLEALERREKDPNVDLTIQKEIETLETKKSKLNTSTIKELLNNENENIAFNTVYKSAIGEETNYNEIKGSYYFGLLKYLIRYGYIDEQYSDYITYFYAKSITLQDKKFLQSIVEKQPLDSSYEISNPGSFIDRIRLTDFENKEVLNYQLLSYLIKNKQYQKQLDKLLEQIKNNSCVSFIKGYLKTGTEQIEFVRLLNQKWTNAFNLVIRNFNDYEFVKQYSLLTLESINDENVEEINIDDCLTDYISNDENYLDINSPYIAIVDKFKLLNVKFNKINLKNCNRGLLDLVFQNGLYIINADNINLIFNLYFDITDEASIKHNNFEILCNNNETPYYDYCIDNINEYIAFYLNICANSINDAEEYIITLLNNVNLEDDYKEKIVEAYEGIIIDLSLINDVKMQVKLINSNKVEYSEKNIICYVMDAEKLNQSQIDFINSSKKAIDFSVINISKDDASKLFNLFVRCNDLLDEKYSQALLSLGYIYEDDFNLVGLESSKISILIKNKIIRMHPQHLNFIRKNYPDSTMDFIKTNIKEYCDIVDDDNFDYDETIEILSWNIDFSVKQKLLSLNTTKINICNHSFEDEVNYIIINSNMFRDNLTTLFNQYDRFGVKSKNAIFELADQHIETILEMTNVPLLLVKELINCNNDANGLSLLLKNIGVFSFNETILQLQTLGYVKFVELLDSSKRPRFDINDVNKRILTCLVQAGFIYDFPENNGYYTVQRTKPRKKFLEKTK